MITCNRRAADTSARFGDCFMIKSKKLDICAETRAPAVFFAIVELQSANAVLKYFQVAKT